MAIFYVIVVCFCLLFCVAVHVLCCVLFHFPNVIFSISNISWPNAYLFYMKLGICFLLTNGFLYKITDYCYLIKIIVDKINGLFSQTSSLDGYYSGASPKDHLYSKTSSLLRLLILEVYKQFYIGTYSLLTDLRTNILSQGWSVLSEKFQCTTLVLKCYTWFSQILINTCIWIQLYHTGIHIYLM